MLHPSSGDAPARGKLERWFRTAREQCTDHISGAACLQDVQVRLLAWLDRYHDTPHAGLMGRTPGEVLTAGRQAQPRSALPEPQLAAALTLRGLRRVHRDGTLRVGGHNYELDALHLAGRRVTVARSLLSPTQPWVELEGRRLPLHPVDPVANSRRRRARLKTLPVSPLPPDTNPAQAALARLLRGRSQP